MANWSHYGFAAEQVAEVDPRLAFFRYEPQRDENGELVKGEDGVTLAPALDPDGGLQLIPEGVQADRVLAVTVATVQDLLDRVEALENT